jgi:outer membrane protein assembly factor BamB
MVIPAAAQLADTPWPMFHHDLNHTGLSPYTGPETNATKWIYTTGGDIRTAPVVGSDGTIYVGSRDDKLHALYSNGTLKWSYPTGDTVYNLAIDADGTIYAGSRDKNLYAMYPNGTLKWSYPTGDQISYSSPAIDADGTIYVGSNDKNLYAIYPNGTLKWSYLTGDRVGYSSPAIDADGTIYVGSKDDKLHAIYPNGTLKWSYLTGGDVYSSPVIGADGTIYVGSTDKKLYAVYPNGTLKWSYLTGGDVRSSSAIGSDGMIYVGSADKKLYALYPNGTLKWSYLTGDKIYFSSPVIDAAGTIYVGSYDNKLHAIYPNGALKWSYLTGGSILSPSPAIGVDGTIYAGSTDDKLYAFGPGVSGNPDLTPTAITTPASIIATQSNSIEATIANIGICNASSFNVSLSADGTPVDTASVDSLTGGGASTDVSFSWTPDSTGGYELCVVADSDGAVDESDETNNGLCKGVTVVAAGPTNEVYFEPSGISASFCEERTVSIWANTSAATTGGKIVLNYTCCCANVTSWVRNVSNFATGAADIYCGYASLTFSSTDVRGPGLVHIGDLTIHCCNESSDCVTDLAFVTGESELIGGSPDFANITPVEWQDGTINCTAPIVTSLTITPDTGITSEVQAYNITVNTTGFTSLNVTIPAEFSAKTPSDGEQIARVDLWWANEEDPHYGYVSFTANATDKMDVYAEIGETSITYPGMAVSYTEGATTSIKSPFGSQEERANLTLPTESANGSLKISGLPDMITNVTVSIGEFVQNPTIAGDYTFTAKAEGEAVGKSTAVTIEAPAPPGIISYAPVSAAISDTEGATRTFSITVDQTVNVTWLINGTVVKDTEKGVTEASYTNTSAAIGTWNVSAVASNTNGTDMQTWIWTVEAPSPCFIATAAYGTSLHEDIDVLREFRDERLMTNPLGRTFVKTYYETSPPIADALREHEGLRNAVRETLIKPLVYISRMFVG